MTYYSHRPNYCNSAGQLLLQNALFTYPSLSLFPSLFCIHSANYVYPPHAAHAACPVNTNQPTDFIDSDIHTCCKRMLLSLFILLSSMSARGQIVIKANKMQA